MLYSTFLPNFIMQDVLRVSLDGGVGLLANNVFDLEQVSDIVLLRDDAQPIQQALGRLATVVSRYGMCFALPKTKELLRDRQVPSL